MKIKCEFAGGLQVLFEEQTSLSLDIPENSTISDLIKILVENNVKRTPELFVIPGNKLRAGILVLINEVDWELENEYDYVIQPNDTIGFISTLHGG
jgi:ubiquitin related modifier 1